MNDRRFEPEATLARVYPEAAVGGFSSIDTGMEFYTRINALVDGKSRVLDVGAGSGSWVEEPMPEMVRTLRTLRGRVAEVVGIDVTPAVHANTSVDRAVVMTRGERLPFDDDSFDLVIADHALEHVDAAHAHDFARELMRITRSGGWLAARTPNTWALAVMVERAVHHLHARLLAFLQPDRPVADAVTPQYSMNTKATVHRLFAPDRVIAYGHTGEPTRLPRATLLWRLVDGLGRVTPRRFAPTLMVFVQKQ